MYIWVSLTYQRLIGVGSFYVSHWMTDFELGGGYTCKGITVTQGINSTFDLVIVLKINEHQINLVYISNF